MQNLKKLMTSVVTTLAFELVVVSAASAEEKLPTGPCEFSTTDASSAAQKCKILAASGNADAMFQFGYMLLKFSADGKSPEEAAKWKTIGARADATRWIEGAANKGSDQAIAYLCSLGSDPNASSSVRAESKIWCEQLQ